MSARIIAIAAMSCVVFSAADAQVLYRRPLVNPYQLYPYTDATPYDQTFGVRPSFEVSPNPFGYGPAVRVIARCNYPDGWNVTDFSRDINGIPTGVHHQCPDLVPGRGRVRAGY